MTIPRNFYLFGKMFSVKLVENLVHRTDAQGQANYREAIIELQSDTPGNPMPTCAMEKTFCHELIHMMLHELHEWDLRDNEKFVDTMAGLLHQFLESKVGDVHKQ